MKKLKPNQLGAWCSYCPPKTNRATHVNSGFHSYYACEEHKANLEFDENTVTKLSEVLTEADYQSWGTL